MCPPRQREQEQVKERSLRVVQHQVEQHRQNNQNDYQRSLWHRARFPVLVPRKEEERRQIDLLDVQPDEDVLDGTREEQATGVARGGLAEGVDEEVLVEQVEEEEGEACKAIDEGRDDRVRDGCESLRALEACHASERIRDIVANSFRSLFIPLAQRMAPFRL